MNDKETLYARWLSNQLSDDELDLLKREGAVDDLERIVKATGSWKLPNYDKVAGLQKLNSLKSPKKAKVRRINIQWIAGIAACFLMVFALFNYYDDSSQELIMATNGTNQNVQMADGSAVSLNDGSSITFNKKNWLKDRTIDLVGEAYFEVEKGTRFTVITQHGSIEVLGTKFNVRAWGDNLYVDCYEGSVKVSVLKDQTILALNQGVSVVSGSMKEKRVITQTAPLWSMGSSRFNNEDIQEVFAELGRQYDVLIQSSAEPQTFSGIFMHNDLEKALESICIPLGLTYRISSNKKEVLID